MIYFTILFSLVLAIIPVLALYFALRYVHIRLSNWAMAIVLPLIYCIPVAALNADMFHKSISDGLSFIGVVFAIFAYLTLPVIALRRVIRFDRPIIKAGKAFLTAQQARKRLLLALPFIVNPATLILVVWVIGQGGNFMIKERLKKTRRKAPVRNNNAISSEKDAWEDWEGPINSISLLDEWKLF